MTCPTCQAKAWKHGTTPAGSQRYRCKNGHTWTDSPNPVGGQPTGIDKAELNRRRVRKFREKKRKDVDV